MQFFLEIKPEFQVHFFSTTTINITRHSIEIQSNPRGLRLDSLPNHLTDMLIIVVPGDVLGSWWGERAGCWSFLWEAPVVGSFVFSRLEPVSVLMAAQGSASVEDFFAKNALILPVPSVIGSCCGLKRTFSLHVYDVL